MKSTSKRKVIFMANQNLNKDKSRKITIKTPQETAEIVGEHHLNPGICPHCHKPIPLSSIVFKKESENGIETYSGNEMAKKYVVPLEKDVTEHDGDTQNNIGECPYCHESIPMREIIFKSLNRAEK